jgi:hypothetical protein
MNRISKRIALASTVVLLTCGPWASTSSFAQSWWPFGDNQEQEKVQSQRQAPVERAFSENYWKLTEKQRALASDKYDEYLRQQKGQSTNDAPPPPRDKSKRTIKSLEAPDNPFQ